MTQSETFKMVNSHFNPKESQIHMFPLGRCTDRSFPYESLSLSNHSSARKLALYLVDKLWNSNNLSHHHYRNSSGLRICSATHSPLYHLPLPRLFILPLQCSCDATILFLSTNSGCSRFRLGHITSDIHLHD